MFGRTRGLPAGWEHIVTHSWAQWDMLSPHEQERISDTADMLLRKKTWEAAGGFDGFTLTDDMRVLVAAQAARLVVGLDPWVYRRVEAIVLWPSTIAIHRTEYTGMGLIVEEGVTPAIGEAHELHGPVLLAWDAVLADAARPDLGRNVVYHEFAHKIDMNDGEADGAPGLHRAEDEARWFDVCDPLMDALAAGESRPPLDPYGGTNEAEFFAVATEAFFTVSSMLAIEQPALYSLLAELYNQDPVND